jgi:predicted metal-dependent enzyme (double-stranded beta helix superfamily)
MAGRGSRRKEHLMAVETTTQNAMDRFVAKTRDLFAEESDPEKRWELLRPILAELLAAPEVIEASKQWPVCTVVDGRAENLLFYVDPDYSFAINASVRSSSVPAGERARIHHHGHIYTLYGLLDGHETIERYERVDDRSKPDYAEIRRTVDKPIGPGEIDLVKPYEIHAEVAAGERRVAVIIRSEKAGEFNQGRFDLETNHYFESVGPRQTPCEMLPRHS